MARSPQERADTNAELPASIKPHLCHLAKEAPTGENWAHELKFDGYRIHARIDRTDVQLLTCTGLDWTDKYLTLAAALRTLSIGRAYMDGRALRGASRRRRVLCADPECRQSAWQE
jgi:bifunctional non-homologous end joining protein LigD